MQLIYRGTTYSYNPTQSAARRSYHSSLRSEAAYNLTYRGMTYQVSPNAKPEKVAAPTTHELIYRGMTYLVNRTVQGKAIVVA